MADEWSGRVDLNHRPAGPEPDTARQLPLLGDYDAFEEILDAVVEGMEERADSRNLNLVRSGAA